MSTALCEPWWIYPVLEINNEKIRWACRRGMLELDLLLPAFFSEKFDQLSPAQQQIFVTLLSEPDQDLYTWILKVEACPQQKFHSLLADIQHYHGIS